MALVTALTSLYTGVPVGADVAMTALLKDAPKGGIALSTAVAAERSVMAYLRDQGLASQVVQSSDLAYGGRRVTLAALDAAGLPRSRRSSQEMRAVVVPGAR